MRGNKKDISLENEFEKIFKKVAKDRITIVQIQRLFLENDIPKESVSDFVEFL